MIKCRPVGLSGFLPSCYRALPVTVQLLERDHSGVTNIAVALPQEWNLQPPHSVCVYVYMYVQMHTCVSDCQNDWL